MARIGLDVGGANVKAADAEGRVFIRPFALWKAPEALPGVLREVLERFDPDAALVVTMTGELADCFANKAEGVRTIVRAVVDSAGQRSVRFYQTTGRLVAADQAVADVRATAASNWHALASFVGSLVPQGRGLLVDVGSTTCDAIRIVDGMPVPRGWTDRERLATGELLYTGVRRSPVACVLAVVEWRGERIPLAHELFATMADVYLALGDLAENLDDCETADGRPLTRAASHARLARMVAADPAEFPWEFAEGLANQAAEAQTALVADSLRRAARPFDGTCDFVVLSGSGEFLGQRAAERADLGQPTIHRLSQWLGAELSTVATAVALARLPLPLDLPSRLA